MKTKENILLGLTGTMLISILFIFVWNIFWVFQVFIGIYFVYLIYYLTYEWVKKRKDNILSLDKLIQDGIKIEGKDLKTGMIISDYATVFMVKETENNSIRLMLISSKKSSMTYIKGNDGLYGFTKILSWTLLAQNIKQYKRILKTK